MSITLPPLESIRKQISIALSEDIGHVDLSASALPSEQKCTAYISSHSAGIVCGSAWVNEAMAQVDPSITVEWLIEDGQTILAKHPLCRIQGHCKGILSAERVALNFLQMLSATATQTAQFVQYLQNIKPAVGAKIFDTRKTIPGLRSAQKYAVLCGGGHNHRLGLYDNILLKENHLHAYSDLTDAVSKLRQYYPQQTIEVEVENLQEVETALRASVDIILLDNFSLSAMHQAVQYIKEHATYAVEIEASGNVSLDNVDDIAKTGVQRISIGALTKNIQALDMSLRFVA